MKDVSQVIIIRKDIQMSPTVFGRQVAHASYMCAMKGVSACISRLGQFSHRCTWYRKWSKDEKYQRILLGVDNEEALWAAHNKILKISQDVPLYVSKIEGYSNENPEMTACFCVGPVELEIIKQVIMHFQII